VDSLAAGEGEEEEEEEEEEQEAGSTAGDEDDDDDEGSTVEGFSPASVAGVAAMGRETAAGEGGATVGGGRAGREGSSGVSAGGAGALTGALTGAITTGALPASRLFGVGSGCARSGEEDFWRAGSTFGISSIQTKKRKFKSNFKVFTDITAD